WQRILSPQPYDAASLQSAFAQRANWTDMGQSYVSSVQYFFDVLASYLRERANDNLVLIVLGDHQPAANVSGEGAPWDVPVHIISKRTDILETLQRQGFRFGLAPTRPSTGKMNELALWLLQAFDQESPQSVRSAPSRPARSSAVGGN